MELVFEGNSILNETCTVVGEMDEETKVFLEGMRSYLEKDDHAAGIAAPQLGKTIRAFAIKSGGKVEVCINPSFLPAQGAKTKRKTRMESCLSIPGKKVEVSRFVEILAIYTNLNGETVRKKLTDWEARCFQHEFDHLKGELITQKGKVVSTKEENIA